MKISKKFPTVWKVMKLYGIPKKIIHIMRKMYDGSESCVGVNQDKKTTAVWTPDLGKMILCRLYYLTMY